MDSYNQLDNQLLQIKGIKWLPWIGNSYLSIPIEKRVLIIGESHYHQNSQESISQHNEIDFTRTVIKGVSESNSPYNTPIFRNLYKALYGDVKLDSLLFWNQVAFYNFIQRPMSSNALRPTTDDFITGWDVFTKISETLQPHTAIFIGTTSASFLKRPSVNINNKFHDVICEDKKINGSYPKTSSLTLESGNTVQLIFIRHSSSRFSWEKWNQFLNKKNINLPPPTA